MKCGGQFDFKPLMLILGPSGLAACFPPTPPSAPWIPRVPSGPLCLSLDPPMCPPVPLVSLGSHVCPPVPLVSLGSLFQKGVALWPFCPPLFVVRCPLAVVPRSHNLVWPSAVAPPSHGSVVPAGRCVCSCGFSACACVCIAVL